MNLILKLSLLAGLIWAVNGTGLAQGQKDLAGKLVGTNAPATLPPRSVFIIPTNVRDGRDPFFPESTRLLEVAVQVTHKVEAASLIIKGFSGPPEHRFVIINNHTFAPGYEGDVLTSNGRAHIRCVEIRNDSVVVEINGQRHEIPYQTK